MVVLNGFTTWGQDLSFHHVSTCQRPYAIMGTFFSSFGDPSQSNALFVEAETCPSVVDKFLCAFLPTTNCGIPESFPLSGEEFSTHHFSSATMDGELISSGEVIPGEHLKWSDREGASRAQPLFLGQRYLPSSGGEGQQLRRLGAGPRTALSAQLPLPGEDISATDAVSRAHLAVPASCEDVRRGAYSQRRSGHPRALHRGHRSLLLVLRRHVAEHSKRIVQHRGAALHNLREEHQH